MRISQTEELRKPFVSLLYGMGMRENIYMDSRIVYRCVAIETDYHSYHSYAVFLKFLEGLRRIYVT